MSHPAFPSSTLFASLFTRAQRRAGVGRFGLLVATLATTVAPAQLRAQTTQTWIDTNADNSWSLTAPNWDSGAVWANGNHALFGGAGETIELTGNITVGDITFNSTGYTIADDNTDSVLTLGAPSNITVTTAGHSATISAPLTAGGITKAGAGRLILSGANSYEGATLVSAGQLRVATNTALGSIAAGTTVSSGAEVVLHDGINVAGETINISGSGTISGGALLVAGNAQATWAGPVALDSGARVGAAAGGILTLSGVIQNGASNSLDISGLNGIGTVVISGTANTYTGPTRIVRGFLQLGATNALPTSTSLDVDSSTAAEDSVFDLNGFNQTVGGLQRSGSANGGGSYITNNGATAATLTVNQSGSTTYNGTIMDGAAPVALTKLGGGALTLSGANTHSGETVVNGGGSNLVVAHNEALGSTSAATAAGNGGRVTLANGITVTGETIRIHGNGDNQGALQAAANATATWAGPVILNDGGGNSPRVGAASGGTLILSGPIQNGIGSSLSISTNGATLGAVIVSGTNNTYTGSTNIVRGILTLGATNALPTGTTLNVDSVANAAVAEDSIFDLNGFDQTVGGLLSHGAGAGAGTGTGGSFIRNTGATASTLTVNTPSASSFTFEGIMQDGVSSLALKKSGGGALILTRGNTYTGATTVNGGTLELAGGSGTIGSTDIGLSSAWLVLNNVGAGNNNNVRIPSTANVTFANSGNISLRGSDQDSTNSVQALGGLTLQSGFSQIKITQGGTNTATISANQFVRSAHAGVAFVSGVNLGMDGTSTESVGRVLLTTAPTLVGATDALASGINAGAQDTKIVPYLVGEADTASGGLGTANGAPNTFLTYTATGGLRPLNPTDEFSNNAVVAGANVRITSSTTASTSTSVNSLVLGANTVTLTIAETLTNTSGAVLFAAGSTINGGTLDFGSAEGIVTVNSGAVGVISSRITGSNGITLSGLGTLGLGSQSSTYSGETTIQSGVLVPQANSQSSDGVVTNGPFGTSTLVFAGGQMRATTNSAVTIGNAVKLQADTAFPSGGNALTLSGPVTIEGGTRTLSNNTGSATTFSGSIGDGGNAYGLTIAGTGSGAIVLSGANTYTGPTSVESGRLIVSGSIEGNTIVGNSAALSATALLGGSGVVGDVMAIGSGNPSTSGATVDPGNSANVAGVLSTGAFSLTNGAHLSLQIGGTTAGGETDAGYDQIVASGLVSLTGGDLKLSLTGSPSFAPGDQLFLIINNGGSSIAGIFGTLDGAAFDPTNITLAGQQFSLVYNANFSGAGSDGIANDLALVAVPEPGSSAILLGCMGVLGFSRRWRRAATRQG